jgi:hypothetical protein
MPKSGPAKVVELLRQKSRLISALKSAATALWNCGENAEARKIERLLVEMGAKRAKR